MREIKFRAWDKNNKRMDKFDLSDLRHNDWDYHTQQDFDDAHIMQYTWLKDKNWVEIYEGDIIGYKEIKLPVVFELWAFKVEYKDTSTILLTDMSVHCVMLKNKLTDIEVIWNIYTNPELLWDE